MAFHHFKFHYVDVKEISVFRQPGEEEGEGKVAFPMPWALELGH